MEWPMWISTVQGGRRHARTWATVSLVLVTTVLLLAACGSETSSPDPQPPATDASGATLMGGTPDRQLSLSFQDISFEPDTLTVAVGEIVEIEIENAGALPHDFTIERIDAELAMQHQPAQHAPAGHDAHSDAAAVHLALAPGDRMVARLRVAEPGTYDFYCAEPGHRDAGMVGTLVVD